MKQHKKHLYLKSTSLLFVLAALIFIAGCKKDSEYWFEQGVYAAKTNPNKAIRYYSRSIRRDRKKAKSYLNRGGQYFIKGRNSKALRDFNKAISINPKFSLAYNNRGGLYIKKKQFLK